MACRDAELTSGSRRTKRLRSGALRTTATLSAAISAALDRDAPIALVRGDHRFREREGEAFGESRQPVQHSATRIARANSSGTRSWWSKTNRAPKGRNTNAIRKSRSGGLQAWTMSIRRVRRTPDASRSVCQSASQYSCR